jgi:CHASE2 domain-containing sensor protein
MPLIGQILSYLAGVGSLVCFILVLIQMFKRENTGLAITCIVLALCCGLGGLIAFIVGWVKNKEWQITPIMIAWTVCILLGIVANFLNPVDFSQFQQQFGK